jgi:hypothetical protein
MTRMGATIADTSTCDEVAAAVSPRVEEEVLYGLT